MSSMWCDEHMCDDYDGHWCAECSRAFEQASLERAVVEAAMRQHLADNELDAEAAADDEAKACTALAAFRAQQEKK